MMPSEVEQIFKPDEALIRQHLEFILTEDPEYERRVEISILNQSENFLREDIEKAIQRAVTWNQEEKNVYVVGSLLDPNIMPIGRSNDTDFDCTIALWCDLDGEFNPEDLKKKYKECPPQLSVITGRTPHMRVHLWWKLNYFCYDRRKVKQALTGIQQALGGDPAVKNVTSLMRLGGTVAWPVKDGRVTEMTEVKETDHIESHSIEHVLKCFPVTNNNVSSHSDTSMKHAITNTYKIEKLLEKTKETGHWNENMLYVIGSMVGSRWSNEQIKLACAPYSYGGSQDQDIIDMLNRTREKFNQPEQIIEPQEFDSETGEIINSTINYILAKDIRPSLDANDFVQGVLGDGQFSVVYGESNCGKTFFMTDLSFHIAMGERWRDKRIEQGGVIYVALEGSYGLINRIAAYRQHNKILNKSMPFAMINSPIDFMNPKGNIDEFINLIPTIEQDIGGVRLIVVDTLSRALMGGDENSGQDMGMLVRHADKIKAHTGAHICFVHHSGKDAARGMRGHSCLRAAIDTEIEVHREEGADYSTINVTKQREMETTDEILGFSLKQIILGKNKYNEDITSCVVEEHEVDASDIFVPLSAQETFFFDAIILSMDGDGKEVTPEKGMTPIKSITYEDFYKALEKRGFKELYDKDGEVTVKNIKSATNSVRIKLKKKSKIGFNGVYIWLIS